MEANKWVILQWHTRIQLPWKLQLNFYNRKWIIVLSSKKIYLNKMDVQKEFLLILIADEDNQHQEQGTDTLKLYKVEPFNMQLNLWVSWKANK